MSAAAPDPAPQATRSFSLLVLVRALIDYGRELTATLRQHGTAALGLSVRHFGTDDVALILARIAHGLHLAAALELRITATAPRLDADPKPHRTPTHSTPRAPRTVAPRDDKAAPLAAIANAGADRRGGSPPADRRGDRRYLPRPRHHAEPQIVAGPAKRHHPLRRQLRPPDNGHDGPGVSASRPHRPPPLTQAIDHTSRR